MNKICVLFILNQICLKHWKFCYRSGYHHDSPSDSEKKKTAENVDALVLLVLLSLYLYSDVISDTLALFILRTCSLRRHFQFYLEQCSYSPTFSPAYQSPELVLLWRFSEWIWGVGLLTWICCWFCWCSTEDLFWSRAEQQQYLPRCLPEP